MRSLWTSALLSFLLAPVPARADDPGRIADVLKQVVVARQRPSFPAYRSNFRLISSEGDAWTLAKNYDSKYVVLAAWIPDCSAAVPLLRWFDLLDEMAPQASVLFLDPSVDQDRRKAEEARHQAGARLPVLMDFSRTVTGSFGLRNAGDYVVVETETGKEVLRGTAFDGALESFLNTPLSWKGRLAREYRRMIMPACAVPSPALADGERKEALKAFGRTCVACHALNPSTDYFTSLKDIRGWHEMNRLVTRMYRMPPGGVDTNSDLCLSPRWPVESGTGELGLVQRWIEAGEPLKGENGEDPAAKMHARLKLEIAKRAAARAKHRADLTFQAPLTDVIPATGTIEYVYQLLGGPLKEDLYVRANSFEANINVLHHAVLYVSPEKPKLDKMGRVMWDEKADRLHLWSKLWEWNAFSYDQTVFPGALALIPKGSYLIIQQHYDTYGKRATNRSRLSFELERHPAGKPLIEKYSFDRAKYAIPPFERRFELVKTHVIEKDSSIVAASTHGHFRATRSYFNLFYPDGSARSLCNVAFHQVQYEVLFALKTPIFVPKGTKIEAHLIYDNSPGNSLNPHPENWVRNGDYYETDEMDVARFVKIPGRAPGSIDLRDRP